VGLAYDQRGGKIDLSIPGLNYEQTSKINSLAITLGADITLITDFYFLVGLKPTYYMQAFTEATLNGQTQSLSGTIESNNFVPFLYGGFQKNFRLAYNVSLGLQAVAERSLWAESLETTDFFNTTISVLAVFDLD
jgi:hypothetical protein